MNSVSIKDVMICWNLDPNSEIRLVPWPDEHDLARGFHCAQGACETNVREHLTEHERVVYTLGLAIMMMTMEGLAPEAVDKAFKPIKEYGEWGRIVNIGMGL